MKIRIINNLDINFCLNKNESIQSISVKLNTYQFQLETGQHSYSIE